MYCTFTFTSSLSCAPNVDINHYIIVKAVQKVTGMGSHILAYPYKYRHLKSECTEENVIFEPSYWQGSQVLGRGGLNHSFGPV